MSIRSLISRAGWWPACFCACFALSAAHSLTAQKQRITTEADLPRFSYPVHGTIQEFLNSSPAEFADFARPVLSDIDATLAKYQIDDHAALRKLLQARVDLEIILGGNDADALKTVAQIRDLEDKATAKLVGNLSQQAYLQARMKSKDVSASGCPVGYEPIYQAATEALPWAAVGGDQKESKSFVELMSPSFMAGLAESVLGPTFAKEHAVGLGAAELLARARVQLQITLPCKQETLKVLSAYILKNDVAKPSIWAEREAVLPPVEKLTPVNVAIWDSGFDTSLFPGRLYVNPDPADGDPHGVAFDVFSRPTHGELIPLTAQEKKNYAASVEQMKAFGDIESGVDSPGATALKEKIGKLSPAEAKAFFDENAILDGFAHGTHVTGIAARGNPAIRLAYARMTYDNGNPHMPPTEQLLKDTADSYAAAVAWFRAHHIRVVNMSWWDRPANMEKDLADNGIGKDAAERKQMAMHFFQLERDSLYAALKSAPEILFVTIAGNSNQNNDFEEDCPSSFRLPNLIVTGAVDQAGDETSFTTVGENVLVDADGNAVESLVPGGATVKMSGTSMAAPQVTNLAAKLLAIDPRLSPTELVALIRDGSDKSADGRLRLLNPKKSVELAEAKMH